MSSTEKIGAWRDRTGLYLSYRLSYGHSPNHRARINGPSDGLRYSDNAGDERAGLMANIAADGDAVIEMDLLPPRWLDIQDEIAASLADISTQMKKLEQLHAKHVLPGFDDESVKAKEEREIEALTQEITRGFTTCQNRIRRIDALVAEQRSHSGGTIPQADEKIAQNLKISLAAKVGEVSTLFRKKQSAYLKKLRSLDGMTTPMDTRAATPAANPYTDPALMDSESDRASAQSTLLQTAQVRHRQTGIHDAVIEQREREIEKIAQGVIELSQIFQELNSMVIDQGTLLDRIDYNVERTHEAVKGAEKELKVATGYQKKSMKRKIILLLILIVVGLFVLLLVKPKKRKATGVEMPVPAAPPPAIGDEVEAGGDGAGGRTIKARDMYDPVSGHRRRRWEWKQRRRRNSGGRNRSGSSIMAV